MLARYCRWSLEWFREHLISVIVEGRSIQDVWDQSEERPELRRFRKMLHLCREIADLAAEQVMAWVGYVEGNFEPSSVPERGRVLEKTEKVNRRKWRTTGIVLTSLEGLVRFRSALGRPEFSVMGLIQYCAHGDWKELVDFSVGHGRGKT